MGQRFSGEAPAVEPSLAWRWTWRPSCKFSRLPERQAQGWLSWDKSAGSTGVTFNGRAAQFTIVSPSEITATVPAGATTGPVQVTTPSGTLTSNIAFQVTYPLAVSTSGNGTITSVDGFINCPGVCSHAYPGTQVTLNAIPGQGWAFSGWSGACSGTGSCMVTVNQSGR